MGLVLLRVCVKQDNLKEPGLRAEIAVCLKAKHKMQTKWLVSQVFLIGLNV